LKIVGVDIFFEKFNRAAIYIFKLTLGNICYGGLIEIFNQIFKNLDQKYSFVFILII